jgi:hypothetical protein
LTALGGDPSALVAKRESEIPIGLKCPDLVSTICDARSIMSFVIGDRRIVSGGIGLAGREPAFLQRFQHINF